MMRRPSLPYIGGAMLVALLSQYATVTQAGSGKAYDVRDLYRTCAVAPDAPDYTVATYACLAFIGGAVQYHDEVSDRKHLKRLICYPTDATVTDGRTAFVEWAKKNAANEERMSEVAVVGLVRALAQKYPCR
jgi:hypothetical protein